MVSVFERRNSKRDLRLRISEEEVYIFTVLSINAVSKVWKVMKKIAPNNVCLDAFDINLIENDEIISKS